MRSQPDHARTLHRTSFPWGSLLIVGGVFLWMLLLYSLTPYTSDDYRYHYIYDGYMPDGLVRPLTSIADIPESMVNHYNLWGGRVVAHSMLQFFMLFDKPLFNLCSALVYVLLGVLICLNAAPRRSALRPLPLFAVYVGMWLFLPQYDLSVMWMSGAFNYLWMAVLILAFLLPFRCYRGKKNAPPSAALKALLMVPFGALAGCTNENSGGAAILLILFFQLYWLLRFRRVPLWSVSAFVSACITFYILVTAPGNSGRTSEPLTDLSILIPRVVKVIQLCLECLLIPGLILLVLLILVLRQRRPSFLQGFRMLLLPAMYVLAGLASVVVLVASPTIGGRSWMWAVCFFLVAAGMLAERIDWTLPRPRMLLRCGLAAGSAAALIAAAIALPNLYRTHVEINHQIDQLMAQKAAGETHIVVDPITPTQNRYNALTISANLTDDPECWFNRWMAVYYQVDSITLTPQSSQEGSDLP